MDSLKELHLHYNRVLSRIKAYEAKASLDGREIRDFREWVSLAGNLCERIFLLEAKDRFLRYDENRVAELKTGLLDGDWIKKKQSTES